MNAWLMMIGIMAVSTAHAEEATVIQSDNSNPTVIYGEAENPDGTVNQIMVRQPKDIENPFGNPIVNTIPYGKQPVLDKGVGEEAAPSLRQQSVPLKPADMVFQVTPQDPQINEDSPEQMQNEIENTLYEGDDRIYDVQSYPDNDINQIEGQDNAVTNYPAY